ncbi:trichodiene oxygenase, partial [Diaporthe sp. PMI_573]
HIPWAAIASTAIAYFVGLVFYRLCLHPLAEFPGPKLAAITRYYEGYYDVILNGQYTFKIAELHQRYGPIVRISPYELHVNDPAYYEKLYRQEGQWNKYDWSYDAFGAPMSAICVSSVDHEAHKRRCAPLNPFFSKASVASRQDMIHGFANKLCDRIAQFEGSTVNITAAVSAFTRDVAMQFVLSKDYRNLDNQDFGVEMTNVLQSSGAIWRVTKHVRWLGPLMKSLPLDWVEKAGDAGTKAFFGFLKDCLQTTKDIVAAPAKKVGGGKGVPTKTIVHTILESNLLLTEKTVERINDEVGTITGAAFETAAQSIRTILYYLYSNPVTLARLREELSQAAEKHGNRENIPLSVLKQLPFLTGCICEGLRLSPGLATRLARVTPDRDLFYGQQRIPAGTPVSMTVFLMHMDETLYLQPDAFNPTRWTGSGTRSDKTFAPFSRGTRSCLGMYLAWAEMYIVIAALIQRFDFKLIGAGPKDVKCASDQFIVGTADTTGIKAIVKNYAA